MVRLDCDPTTTPRIPSGQVARPLKVLLIFCGCPSWFVPGTLQLCFSWFMVDNSYPPVLVWQAGRRPNNEGWLTLPPPIHLYLPPVYVIMSRGAEQPNMYRLYTYHFVEGRDASTRNPNHNIQSTLMAVFAGDYCCGATRNTYSRVDLRKHLWSKLLKLCSLTLSTVYGVHQLADMSGH